MLTGNKLDLLELKKKCKKDQNLAVWMLKIIWEQQTAPIRMR